MKVKAAAIVVFTFSGRAARCSILHKISTWLDMFLSCKCYHLTWCIVFCRLIAKYRAPMPVLAVVFPREGSDPSKWRSYGTIQVSNRHIYLSICMWFSLKGSVNLHLLTVTGEAMFFCERCLPFDGEYWRGMYALRTWWYQSHLEVLLFPMLNIYGGSGCFLFGDLRSNYLRVALNFLITAMNFLSPSLIFLISNRLKPAGSPRKNTGLNLHWTMAGQSV